MTVTQRSNRIVFERNYWVLLSLIVPITILGILFLSLFTFPLIISISNGLSLKAYEIWGALFVNIIVLGLVFFAWAVGIIESSIEFTELSISKKGVIRSTTIRWPEIVTIYTVGTSVVIKTYDKKIEVNMVYYRKPEIMIQLLQEKYKSESGFGNTKNT